MVTVGRALSCLMQSNSLKPSKSLVRRWKRRRTIRPFIAIAARHIAPQPESPKQPAMVARRDRDTARNNRFFQRDRTRAEGLYRLHGARPDRGSNAAI